MDIQAVEKMVAKIKANLFKKSNSYALGMFKSHFRGKGLQFKEHQIYNYGDEVRFIDWKLVAKTGVPFIKTFEEERNLVVTVIIDAQSTMLYGFQGISKLQAACEICCLLFLLSQRTKDKIKVVLLADKVIEVPTNFGDKGMVNFLSILQRHNLISNNGLINNKYYYSQQLSMDEKLQALKANLRTHRETVVISDFQDFIPRSEVDKILSGRNIHLFQISSPIDEATDHPYTLAIGAGIGGKQCLRGQISSHVNHQKLLRGRNLRRLRVEDRYLEHFVREMI